MKRILLMFAIILSLGAFAQSPESVNYQAVARNLGGVPLVNQSVDVRFTIHQATAVGPSVFQETHATSTNNFGLINLALGSVNTVDFSVINWSLGTFFLQVELDDGSGFVDMGSTQLLSVPYALYAETSGDGPAGLNSLMQSTVEPAGANCANGGYFVQSWLDVDDDGTLSAGETSIDYYICNGLNGVNGTNGTNGVNGNDGVGIDSTIHNADGTLTIYYSNSTTYNSNDITGPMGPAGTSGTVYTEGTGISLLGDSITNIGDADNDPTNEIELPATAVASEVLTWNGSAWVAQLPSTGDDWGTEVVNVSGTNISGDGTILDPIVVTDGDNDPTNELELPMTGNTLGDVLQWDGSNWVSQAAASGADDWGVQTVVSDASLIGDGTTGTPLSVTPYTAGTAIDVTGNVVTNTAPDQTVLLQSAGATTVSGTYPSFTISSTDNVNDADFDPTNEIELPATATTNQVLTWNGSAWVAQNPGSGADNWGSQTAVTDGSSITGDGTAGSPITLSGTIPTNTSDLTNDSGFITNANDADNDPTNEIELPATGSTNDVLTWNGSAWVSQTPGAGADNWGGQTAVTDGSSITGDGTAGSPITLSGTIPSNTSDLTNDSGFITNANDADFDPTNEIQDVSIIGNSVAISGGGTGFDLSSNNPTTGDMLFWDGSSWTSQPVAGININDADFDPTNEIELPATASTNDVLIWDGSNWVAGTAAADGDGNSTNEIQSLTYVSGSQNLSISGGNSVTLVVDDADANATNELQTLSFADPNLTLSNGGGTIDLSGLSPTTYWSPNATDIYSNNTGNVGIGISPVHKLDVSGGINTNSVYHIDGITFLDNRATSTLVGNTDNSVLTGSYNILVGQYAGRVLTSGVRNTVMGRNAGSALTTQGDNTLIGLGSGQNLSGSSNTIVGSYAGFSGLTSGNSNTLIGYNADASVAGINNATGIGANVDIAQDNTVILGNNADIGIGTSTPTAKLHLEGTIRLNNLSGTAPAIGSVLTSMDALGNAEWQPPASVTTFWDGSAGVVYPATLTDNVGVGIASPTEKLHVYIPAGSGNISLETPFAGELSYKIKNTNTDFSMVLNGTKLHFREGAGDIMTFGSYNVGIGTINPLYKFHVENSALRRTGYFMNMTSATNVVNDELMGVYGGAHGAGSSDKIGGFFESSSGTGVNYGVFAQALGGGTNWAGYFGSGDVYIQNNLGIGILSPSQKLHVAGNTTSDDYLYNSSQIHYCSIGASIVPNTTSADFYVSPSGNYSYFNSGTAGTTYYATTNVSLPDGAKIIKFDVWLYDNDGTYNATASLLRQVHGGTTSNQISGLSTSTQSATPQQVSSGTLAYIVDNSANVYKIRFDGRGTNANIRFYTARITYSVDKAD